MAHTVSARKRIRQSEKRRLANKSNRSFMRTAVKKFNLSTTVKEATNVEETKALFKEAVSAIAKTVRKGKIHKNQAARRISRLTLKFNALNK